MYRVSEDKVRADQVEYKKNYAPFRPFSFTNDELFGLAERFANLITTQNGQDTDDYSVEDNTKTERYLKVLPPESKVLILGVGTGREVLTAKGIGLQAIGTTLGSRNIDFGIKYLGLSETEILECANEVLPFPAETFDMVAGFQIFEHTLSPLLFLLEQFRVLKMGGTLLLEWPPADQFTMDDNPHHQVCFTPGQAHGLFRKAGFADVKLYYDDLTPIEEEDWWRGDQKKMLVVEGKKAVCHKDYVIRATNMGERHRG